MSIWVGITSAVQPMPDDGREPMQEYAVSVLSRPDGWWIVGMDGRDIAGPFKTLPEVEDWIDSVENRRPRLEQ